MRKVKSARNNSRRRVSSVTKEPIPTEKLNVLEQNFKRHHYVSPEVSVPPCSAALCVALILLPAICLSHRPADTHLQLLNLADICCAVLCVVAGYVGG